MTRYEMSLHGEIGLENELKRCGSISVKELKELRKALFENEEQSIGFINLSIGKENDENSNEIYAQNKLAISVIEKDIVE